MTTSVDQVVAAGEATDAIVNGFKVSSPGHRPPHRSRPAAAGCTRPPLRPCP